MKRVAAIITVLLFLLSLYYDLKVGTLPLKATAQMETAEVNAANTGDIAYVEHIVSRGETVLSIVERYTGTLPVEIDTVVQDFISLNQMAPEQIQAGKIYKIPIYRD
ncbi:hypothetical protein SAMN05877753_102109 [Bacillus oleivorans]|uniref:LysM domain-containing protein n=1 Tax=Bacillus oleivorans TaxID=1448271 RepID=A0A285CKM0_9BACI|nr:hypothetical protein [Bacillus oleivorans]SNX67905.1 hypothetical protein SAMN05877753_102109 [Bacillus oleivorans]